MSAIDTSIPVGKIQFFGGQHIALRYVPQSTPAKPLVFSMLKFGGFSFARRK
jgi:hypothetical protein